jgi:5-phospho-D-xylono-1,4-lactonase
MTGAFIRTILGDIDPTDLGVTFAHEHVIVDGGRQVELDPDFDLGDVSRMAEELDPAVELGLRAVVDASPADAGRNVRKLADLSRRVGVHIIASAGLHHARFYGRDHWSDRATVDEIAELFIADIVEGIDERDYSGPIVHRTKHRAGVIKIAGSEGGPSSRDLRIIAAAAESHGRTGVPILTHCEGGTGGLELLRSLLDRGVAPDHIVLSHVDKVVDRAYHRELATAGAVLEYDQAFRWGDGPNGTLQGLAWLAEDGLEDRVVLGSDAARQGYLRVFGGSPGLAFLLDGFSQQMAERGLDELVRRRIFVDNPARAFSFTAGDAAAHDPRTSSDSATLLANPPRGASQAAATVAGEPTSGTWQAAKVEALRGRVRPTVLELEP